MAGAQGISGCRSSERTYTIFLRHPFLSEKCSAVTSRWCVSPGCDHQENPTSSRQGSKGFLRLDHRAFLQPYLTPGDRATV